MEFRRETAAHPEDNCEYYNRMLLRARARQHKQPVVGISAHYEGISHAEGQKLDDERFSGLATHLELAEEARVIITHNLHVEFGLMNGAQGTVKGILFARNQPRAPRPKFAHASVHSRRLPEILGSTILLGT